MHLTSVATVAAALLGTTSALPQKLASRESSIVKGKTFDRFVSIWLENTDYDKAAGDRESCLHPERVKKQKLIYRYSKSQMGCKPRHYPDQL
jgi:hypothetical protein